jgi:prepilin-type N-terminal cleavage/methylation domain-containing protein
MTQTHSKKFGFTLIELLIATTIFLGVALVLYSSFSNAIKVWRQTKDSFDFYQTANLSLDIISRDLRNSINYDNLGFAGESDKLIFAGLINCAKPDEDKLLKPGTISYYLDEAEAAVVRKTAPVGSDAKQRQLAWPVDNLNFSYLSKTEEGEYIWSDTWDNPASRPEFIKINFLFKKPNSDEKILFSRTIFIPTGAL